MKVLLFLLALFCPFALHGETIESYPQPFNYPQVSLPQSVFHDWNEAEMAASQIVEAWTKEPASLAITRLQLELHVKHKTMPTRGARGLALVHVAMQDAYWLANERKFDARIAMLMAASAVLSHLYVTEERAFDRLAFSVAAKLEKGTVHSLSAKSRNALALGSYVGAQLVKRALNDGAQRGWNGSRLQWYGEGRYYGPGAWEPTPPYFYFPPDEPFAPTWKTWVLESGAQFRPTPPAFGSDQYRKEIDEVLRINKTLTADQIKIAKFWVDGHGSVTPPGRWNQIASQAALDAKLSEKQTIELFAALNIALADCFVAVWDAKYFYWTARPITAVPKLTGESLVPPILTPPFPSYPSGHAAFSAAAAAILAHYIPAQKTQFEAMAEEAAISRLLGGIHFRSDNVDGAELGKKVARAVLRDSDG
jgi:hypothetical protein